MRITGRVNDKSAGDGLPFANVYFSDATGKPITPAVGTISNEFGRYNLTYNGSEYITASMVGFTKDIQKITAGASIQQIDFDLVPGVELSPVEISATAIKKKKTWIYWSAGILLAIGLAWYFSKKRAV